MLKRYTEEEMLALRKRRLGLSSSPGVVGTSDGNRLDAKLTDDIRAWYADLLLTAPRQLLPCEDPKDESTGRYVGENCTELVLPERGVRFVSLKLEAWDAAVEATFAPASRRAGLQKYRETWATPDAPVIVEGRPSVRRAGFRAATCRWRRSLPGEAGNVPPYRPLPPVESLMMVAAPADGAFVFRPVASQIRGDACGVKGESKKERGERREERGESREWREAGIYN